MDQKLDKEIVMEFGGPVGAVALIIWSHCIVYYFWICLSFNRGHLLYPSSFSGVGTFLKEDIWGRIVSDATPNKDAILIYSGFVLIQAIFAVILPGPKVKGLPIPSEKGKQLTYNCNAVAAWYVSLFTVGVLHYTGYFSVSMIIDNLGPLLSVAVIWGDAVSLATYLGAFIFGKTHRMSGNIIYDFFMGAWLNPRIGSLDLKMFAEIRVAWIFLFLITLGAAAKQYEMYGVVSSPMIFMVVAHFLYANACMKGEECVVTTWDIFYEKWGWMLIYWNFAGVPFMYTAQSIFLVSREPFEHSLPFTAACFTMLLVAYYVWDTANSQKNRFRMILKGTYVKRWAFPQLPWGTLDNPKYIKTEQGGTLLISGWWGYARKIHYTADIITALTWGLMCGFDAFIPYFYFFFFTGMINHRCARDMERCAKKYGKDWEKYCKAVPYIFIPYVY